MNDHPEEEISANDLKIKLSPARPEDEQFLMEVYACTRAQEMAQVPWSEEQRAAFIKMQFDAQSSHYKQVYPEAVQHIIYVGGERLGRAYIARRDKEIRILDITVLPEHRNRKVGSTIVEYLIAEAEATGKPVRIYVESFNPSLRLFERLGFLKIEETGIHYLMEWRPKA